MIKEKLPEHLTSYDIFKTIAVLLMIIDHIGYFFFPEEMWFRTLGRLCVPIWFFLIGYARSRDLSWPLWVGMAFLVFSDLIFGHDLLPVNILATIILIRLTIDKVMRFMLIDRYRFWLGCFMLILLIIPSYGLVEYGAQGLLLAVFGYLLRHRDEIRNANLIYFFMIFSIITFAGTQSIFFGLNKAQTYLLFSGVILVNFSLLFFKAHEFKRSFFLSPVLSPVLKFFGRYTLEIYVGHILVFQALAYFLGNGGVTF